MMMRYLMKPKILNRSNSNKEPLLQSCNDLFLFNQSQLIRTKRISFVWASYPGLLLKMGELLNYLCLKFGSEVVGFFKINFPFLSSKSVVLKSCCPFVLLFAASFIKVVFDLFLNCVSEGEVFDQQIFVDWYFF